MHESDLVFWLVFSGVGTLAIILHYLDWRSRRWYRREMDRLALKGDRHESR
jgi:hypothetical protein